MSGDRAFIAARVPHQGRMCLLDRLLSWDDGRIHCRSTSHLDEANPLRAAGRLGASCALEYAAQAMALHASLRAAGEAMPRPGLLVAVRELRLDVARLDTLGSPLEITCTRLDADASTLVYAFEVTSAGLPVARGRATLVHGLAPAGRAA